MTERIQEERLGPGEFFGVRRSAMSGETVEVTLSHYGARANIGLHSHVRPYLSFVLHGDYREHVGCRQLDCAVLAARFHPAGEEHADQFGRGGGVLLNIELGEQWAESVARLHSHEDTPLLLDSAAYIAYRAAEECYRGEPDAYLTVESLTAELLTACETHAGVRARINGRSALRRAMDYIEDGLSCPLSLPTIASQARLHPSHFARSFRQATGRTVGQYVRHRRLVRAQRLLVSRPQVSISMIAAECGFYDHAHLAHCFVRDTGETPSAFRARAKGLV